MERNFSFMKVLVGCLIVGLLFGVPAMAQQTRGMNISPVLLGSVSQGKPTGAAISLSISDAIDRALKYNLGAIVGEQETRVTRAARVRAMSELLPKVTGSISESVQQINLAAYGFGGFPGQPQVVGPFSLFDARARYGQTVFDLKLIHELRSKTEQVNASNFGQQDVRELVVLITTDLYLEAVAGASRADSARAQLRTAQAVFDRSRGLKDSGAVAGIDVLRAQVQLQAQQQRVLAAENDLAKQKLNLALAIGLPQAQTFTQSDSFVTAPATLPGFDEALATALESRPDYQRSQALVRAAEETRKAAEARRHPSLQF